MCFCDLLCFLFYFIFYFTWWCPIFLSNTSAGFRIRKEIETNIQSRMCYCQCRPSILCFWVIFVSLSFINKCFLSGFKTSWHLKKETTMPDFSSIVQCNTKCMLCMLRWNTVEYFLIGQTKYFLANRYEPEPAVVSIPEEPAEDYETIQSPGYTRNQRGKRSLPRDDTERIPS